MNTLTDNIYFKIKKLTLKRPKLFFDAVSGSMTHLLNGVCSKPQCPEIDQPCVQCKLYYPDYTLVAPLDV